MSHCPILLPVKIFMECFFLSLWNSNKLSMTPVTTVGSLVLAFTRITMTQLMPNCRVFYSRWQTFWPNFTLRACFANVLQQLFFQARNMTAQRSTSGHSGSSCTRWSAVRFPLTARPWGNWGSACSGGSTGSRSTCRPTVKTCSKSFWCSTRPEESTSRWDQLESASWHLHLAIFWKLVYELGVHPPAHLTIDTFNISHMFTANIPQQRRYHKRRLKQRFHDKIFSRLPDLNPCPSDILSVHYHPYSLHGFASLRLLTLLLLVASTLGA